MKITKELQDTLIQDDSITQVHFDVRGKHWFEAHLLPESRDNTKKSLYGLGVYSHSQLIPGELNVDNITERISKGNPDTKIVTTMSREEVLNAEPFQEKENIAARFMSASAEEKAAIFAAMGIDPADFNKKEALPPTPITSPVVEDEDEN